MKKITHRAYSALIIATCVMLGLLFYTLRFSRDGADWALFTANKTVYENGMISVGTVKDRNGLTLAHAQDGIFYYSDDYATRVSSLHAVGDYEGNIGTGALSAFRAKLSGYSHVFGMRDGGGTVTLSVDAELNNAAYRALAGRNGAVMLMDYKTGEILCMVSTPSFDPNVGFDSASAAFDGAYINRTISSTYVPGSVFKLITLAAAIERIPDLYTRSFYCDGSVTISGSAVTCAGVHGSQSIEQALANSCNCAFAELSLELGSEKIIEYAENLGLCEALSINGISTKAGSVEAAVEGSAELAWTGIGQHKSLVSPYAMLRFVSAVANGGTAREGSLLEGERSGTARLLSADTAGKIALMMAYNVTSSYGENNFPGLNLRAKTGTAETGDGTSHSWFVGFLDDREHPYAFVVVIEHGGSGLSTAGSLANTLLQAAVSK